MLSKGEQFKAQFPEARITDIAYEHLVDDPIQVLQEIYRGQPFTDQMRQSFLDLDRINDRFKYGRHSYRMEDFNVDQEALAALVRLQQQIQQNTR